MVLKSMNIGTALDKGQKRAGARFRPGKNPAVHDRDLTVFEVLLPELRQARLQLSRVRSR
jgi:hypothetical protein